MPAALNADEPMSTGGPSVASGNGSSSSMNGKGNASAFGNGVAQINEDGTLATESGSSVNGKGSCAGAKLRRAEELDDLLNAVKDLVIPFIKGADDAAAQKHSGQTYRTPSGETHNILVDTQKPAELVDLMKVSLPEEGKGKEGLLGSIQKILQYSVNTWDQGFLDKLFASNTPVGVISDMILSVLNTNAHVFQVSPALTVVEKTTAKALANLFGFTGSHAGGMTCQGGSASNLTSMVIARNTLFPDVKTAGNTGYDFVVLTGAHSHYSIEKSAMICGLGSNSVWSVPVDKAGCMKPDLLREMVLRAKAEGKTPFYVNATSGSTVRGAFEPLEAIAAICKEFGLWMHIDASFGGPVIFSKEHRWKMTGSYLADSLTVNPHKMMNVPSTCSFLLGQDMRIFNKANSTAAGYLFHSHADGEVWDMADLTLQCGRRADSLKLALAWQYYGSAGFERQIDHAFDMMKHLWSLVSASRHLELVFPDLPSCLQVCFYYAPGGNVSTDSAVNTERTSSIASSLIPRGFMVDYAPGEKGSFLRVVVNCQTQPTTVEGLVKAVEEVGQELYPEN